MNKLFIAITLGVVFAMTAHGGKRLRFTRIAKMEDSGIRILLPAESEPAPVIPPPVFVCTLTSGENTKQVEAQSVADVWRWKQSEGRWVDEDGNIFVLASASLSVPSEPFPKLILSSAMDSFLKRLELNGAHWNQQDLIRWLEVFIGKSDLMLEKLSSRPFSLQDAFLVKAPPADRIAGAAFRLKTEPGIWRFAFLEIAADTGMDSAVKAISENFLPSIQALPKRAVRRNSSMENSEPADGRQPAITRARESIRNMKGWWYEAGEHAIVLSNIRSGKSQLVSAILEDLEVMRPFLEKLVSPWSGSGGAAVIRVFGTAEEYVRYVGQDHAWTAGVYMPMQRELVIRPVEEGSILKNRRAVLSTVYHEAFHQYLDEAFERTQASPWFNEGYASLFSSISISGRGVKFEKDREAVAVILKMIRAGKADPERLLMLDYGEFYAEDPVERRENYALAWGLMYFLQGEPENRKTARWRDIPLRYASALRISRNMEDATKAAFEDVSMVEFTQAFHAFWK